MGGEQRRAVTLRPAAEQDGLWAAELAVRALSGDHQRLGRPAGRITREVFLQHFRPDQHFVVQVDGKDVGLIAIRKDPSTIWIEHFYLVPEQHGHGVGGAVLNAVIREHSVDGRPLRLTVNHGSRARALYERHGFARIDDAPSGFEDVMERAFDPSDTENGPPATAPNQSA